MDNSYFVCHSPEGRRDDVSVSEESLLFELEMLRSAQHDMDLHHIWRLNVEQS